MLSWAFGPLGLSDVPAAKKVSLLFGSPLVLSSLTPHEVKFVEPQGLTTWNLRHFLPSRKDAGPSGLFPDRISDLFGP